MKKADIWPALREDLRSDRGAVPVFEGALLFPLVFLSLFLLLFLSLNLWKISSDYAECRYQIMQGMKGDEKDQEPADCTPSIEGWEEVRGLLFQRLFRTYSGHFYLPDFQNLTGSFEEEADRTLIFYLNQPDTDLWHLLSFRQWFNRR